MNSAPIAPEEIQPKDYALLERAAIEGVPVGAIARIVAFPIGEVYTVLDHLKASGRICDIPRADWLPTSRFNARMPDTNHTPSDDSVRFACQRVFRLTPLEAGFLATLLRLDNADKATLHRVVENTRFSRAHQPSKMEVTDPKMVDVMICKLRKKLRDVDSRLDTAVKTIWGGGYYIDKATKTLINEMIFSEDDAVAEKTEIKGTSSEPGGGETPTAGTPTAGTPGAGPTISV